MPSYGKFLAKEEGLGQVSKIFFWQIHEPEETHASQTAYKKQVFSIKMIATTEKHWRKVEKHLLGGNIFECLREFSLEVQK